jgi:regulator of sirC expression with transglutaminase-like and TPR domain
VHGFTGNTTNFFAPQNHFINQVIETKKGGPVALAICYSVIAQKLGLPIFGVSLPKNYLLAYKDRYQTLTSTGSSPETILFYINPFNRGAVISRKEIEHFLSQNNIEAKEEYFRPCSNRTTISQLLASLMIAYQKIGNSEKVSQLQTLLDITTGKYDQE